MRASLPPANVPLVNQSGVINPDWYDGLLAILNRTGGTATDLVADALSVTGAGIVVVTTSGDPSAITRSIAVGTGLNVSHGDGTAGNPTISFSSSDVATFAATPSSANLRAALTDETGTGAAFFAGGNAGVFTGTSLALGGATIGSDALGVTGTATISGAARVGGNLTVGGGAANAIAKIKTTASHVPQILFYDTTDAGFAFFNSGSGTIFNFCSLDTSGAFVANILQFFAGGIYPATDNALTLGGASNRWSKIYTVDLSVGGTFTINGPLTVTASGLTQGYVLNQTLSGTASGATNANLFNISSDTVDAGSNFVNGFTVQQYTGAGATGGRETIAAYGYITGIAAGGTNNNFVAVTGAETATGSLGGTALAPQGAIFGGGFVGVAQTGATHLLNLTGAEFNTAAQTGSSVVLKSLAQFCGRTDDAVAGSTVNAMAWFYNQTGGVKWSDLFYIDDSNATGAFPLATTASLIRLGGSGTITNGIDLSGVTITGSAFKSSGFSVSGAGAVVGATATIGAGSAITTSGPGGALTSVAYASFGTGASNAVAGGVITGAGPTGSATVVPIITYNAAGQLTTVSTATIAPAIGSITGLGTGVATAAGNNVNASGGFATSAVTSLASLATVGTLTSGTIGAGFTAIANARLANSAITIGGAATSLGATVTATTILDSIGSTRGSILYRGASGWAILAPGTSTNVLTTGGAGADPAWSAAGTGTVTSVTAYGVTVTGSGTLVTTGQTPATATNDDASSNKVGYYPTPGEVLIGSEISLTSGTISDITSISLLAGDWDVWGSIGWDPANTTITTVVKGWISTTSATTPGNVTNGGALAADPSPWTGAGSTATIKILPLGVRRISLSGTTTVYLSQVCLFSASTMGGFGSIFARRVR